MEALAKKIAWQLETRKSVEMQVLTKIEIANPPPSVAGSFDSCEEHFLEMAGKRRCDFVYTSAGTIVRREEYFWDGSKAAAVSFAQGPERTFEVPSTVTIGRNYFKEDAGERMERPSPILFLHVGREPLHKALPKARRMGTATILDRECDLFLFKQVRWNTPQDQLYYLDRETGLPLSVEGYPNYSERDKPQAYWIWKAESLDKVGEFSIPLKSVMIHYNQEKQPAFTWTSTVKSVEFNKDFPASTFWPAESPGLTVIDTIKQQLGHVELPEGQPHPLEIAAPAQAAPTAQIPLTWTDGTSRVFIGMGVLLLLIGVVMTWRRHLDSKADPAA